MRVLPDRATVFRALLITLLSLTFLTACCPGEQVDERGWPKELVLGLVPALEAEALVDNLDPLTEHLEAELGIPVRSFVPQDYTGLVEALGSGRADIGMLPPFAAMLGARRYDIETILISVRKGATGYRSQWFTNDPSVCEGEVEIVERRCETRVPGRTAEIRRFAQCQADLSIVNGESIAFVDPNSTSGFLFPAVQLMDMDINPERDVNSLFVGGHDAAVLAVYAGDTRFGVSYDDARNMVCGQYPDVGEKVIVFNYAPMLPNDGVQLRPGLPDDLRQAIMDAFIGLAESQAHLPDDQKTLWVLYEIDGFVPLTPGLYDPVREAYELMRR
ncbi:phosphate/phosphite/phosphonate ABC transporter substrate-binding protein [Wenzhouxiangella marina]|uniref:Phosphonate ABC transporter phosphonate-binding protein n=1 Tax=Wenzhouxiangella marina TaxID=1579979 RepID=A0A0K0XTN2_9GAMM|nr:phosphate/phosphite/phosphonate ABC transporter substrate-binding protein [Wenzhouxiangella marina]AKS41043.1 Phosphonate ABC transporter phosphonate-binding protein [Wenzhouxiangella marina]MBB6087921.1 phosphonate transport system substrate-binding protein [Wenzhouxiangella marina]